MKLDIVDLCILFALVIFFTVVISLFSLTFYLKKNGKVTLVQGKLKNSDNFLCDAVPYLKLTNKWETDKDEKATTGDNKEETKYELYHI